jgi:hypothetical protein
MRFNKFPKDLPFSAFSFVPCGKCLGCRLDYAREWSIRCVHESRYHQHNCFLTLTYNDEFLPKEGVSKRALQLFIKRLRDYLGRSDPPVRISHLSAGEYGSRTGRAHYHCLIFGWQPSDLKVHSKSGSNYLYRSKILEDLWPFGHSLVALGLNYESCCYVARYTVKKQILKEVIQSAKKAEPFLLSSRRPAIGSRFVNENFDELVRQEKILIPGKGEYPYPAYYKKKLYEKGGFYERDRIAEKKRPAWAERHRIVYESEDQMRAVLKAQEEIFIKNSLNIIKGEKNA